MSTINTHEYDKKGRCVRHPTTRLRKKKFFGGWKIIFKHCPDCAIAAFKDKHKKDLTASDCSRTTATASTSSDERCADIFCVPPCPSPEKSQTDTSSRRTVVCGLRYINPQNQTRRAGSYTGEVKVGTYTYIPDGIGTLRYKDGSLAEGTWRNGEIVVERELSFKCVPTLSNIQEGPISSTNLKPAIKSSQRDNLSAYFNKQSGSTASDNIQSHRYQQRTRFSATRSVCMYDLD